MNTQTVIRTARFLFLGILLIYVVALTGSVALAQTKTFNWDEWNIDVTLLPDGSMEVIETQTLNFSGAPFTFGFRSVPTGRAGNNDGIRDVRVREGDLIYRQSGSESPGTFNVVQSASDTTINWFFEPALGRHTYTFSYIVDGAVRTGTSEQGSGDQIFWTVIPSDHPARVDGSRTTITLPEGVYPQKYTGTDDYLVAAYINERETDAVNIQVSPDERVITYDLLRPLMPGEALNVRVQFPHGLLPTETPAWQATEQRNDVIGLGMLALSLLLLVTGPLGVVALWYTRGRDPQLGVVIPDYITEPPDELPPAMVGALVDEKVDMQDIVSTLIDLARRGYVLMEEQKKTHVFQRTDKQDKDLRPFEKTFLKRLFRGKNSQSLSSLQYKFSGSLPELRSQIDKALVDEDLVPRSPQAVRTSYTLLGVMVLILGVLLLIALGILLAENAFLACFPMLAVVATSIALFIAARHMPRKTLKGAETAAKWNAFKTYLKNIQQYTDLESAGDIFEKYLGYAIAFGLERSYINTFSKVPSTPIPPWYMPMYPVGRPFGPMFGGSSRPTASGRPAGGSTGGGMPTLGDLSGGLTGGLAGMSGGLTRMLNNTSTVMRSTPPPSSSGSGSSFGGGFSGGSSGGFQRWFIRWRWAEPALAKK
jgi:uncharacterized protein (TIGR04222 family)